MPTFDDTSEAVSRRTILKTAAWATPTIVLATAVPAVAASGDEYALTVAITGFGADMNWAKTDQAAQGAGTTAFAGPGYVTWQATITNAGPGPVPVGTLVTFGMGSGRYMSVPAVTMDGADLTPGQDYEGTAGFQHWWPYVTVSEIPAGGTATFDLRGFLDTVPDSAYGLSQIDGQIPSWEWQVFNINVFVRAHDSDGTQRQANAAQRIVFYVNNIMTSDPAPVIPNTTYTPLPQS